MSLLSCNITESSQPFPKCQIFLTPLIGQNLTNLTSQTPGLLEYFSFFWKHSYIWTCIRIISCRVLIGSFKNVICKKPVFVPGVSAAEFSLAHLNQMQSSHWFISNLGCEKPVLAPGVSAAEFSLAHFLCSISINTVQAS